MHTLNNADVYRTLRQLADTAYPEKAHQIRHFKISIHAQESATKHGDYAPHTAEIRIFNLSRKTAHIIKTTIHELAHHIDCSLYGKTGHDKQFYTTYKHLLETAHSMGIINLADTTDEIDSRDLSAMAKKVGAPTYTHQQAKEGWLIKIDNAFAIKDQLKARGYRFSATEKLWLLEVDATTRTTEETWVNTLTTANNIRIVPTADNSIQSVYFAIIGKKLPVAHNQILKDNGFRFDTTRGWYKRILAADTDSVTKSCSELFGIKPTFTGTL